MKRHPDRSRAGSALIVVLAILVLLTVIVLAVLFRSRVDLSISQNYSNQASVKSLSETALNLIIEQIRSGTSKAGQTWISQPGLIRTFDNSGNPVAAYKLYSSATMTDTTGKFNPISDTQLLTSDNWSSQPNLYVDLNSPVMVPGTGGTTAVFPIVDGNNMKSLLVGNKQLLTYATSGGGMPDIEGFGVNLNDPNYTVNYTAGSTPTTINNPVPMPVKWLYVLQDGTLLSATASGSSGDVTVGGGTGPSPTAANPIVGRVAFWTDDESCKVNINTAGEGTYWDTPVGVSQPPGGPGAVSSTSNAAPTNVFDPDNTYETDLASREPVKNEFQHVPGHPATTSLSTVLGASMRDALGLPTGPDPNDSSRIITLTGTNYAKFVQNLDALSPYLNDTNGSVGGTVNTDAGTIAGNAIISSSSRFYANSDELFYSPVRATQSLATQANIPSLMAESRFFLTADSSAPEVNVFGKPRVAIWPIPLNNRTSFDSQVALCSTVGTGANVEPFYFTRSDPTSSTKDWTSRNAAVYTYLTGLATSAWPGYGGNFLSKYGADCNQIFTEICDYIRCTNLIDPTAGGNTYTQFSPTFGSGTVTSPAMGQVVPLMPGNGTQGAGRIATISSLAVVLDKIDPRWDTGQAETATLVAGAKVAGGTVPISPSPYYNYFGAFVGSSPLYQSKTPVEVALVPQLFCPNAGSPPLANDIRIRFRASDLANFSITQTGAPGGNGTYYPFQNKQPDLFGVGQIGGGLNQVFGGYIGISALTAGKTSVYTPSPLASSSNVPTGAVVLNGLPPGLSGNPVGQIVINACTINVDIYAPNGNTGTPIQSFAFNIPQTIVTMLPNLAITGTSFAGNFGTYTGVQTGTVTPTGAQGARWGNQSFIWPERSSNAINSTTGTTQTNMDIVRAIEPSSTAGGSDVDGDMRLVAYAGAGSGLNAGAAFVAQPTATQSASVAATIFSSYNFYSWYKRAADDFPNTQIGWLVAGLPLPNAITKATPTSPAADNTGLNSYPPLPEAVNGANNYLGQPGDWDNGQGIICDGPYLNHPDEGAVPDSENGTVAPASPYIGDHYILDFSTPPSQFLQSIQPSVMVGMLPTALFIPQRELPSPVMFGSLPTGVIARHPWQTLLFRPAKSYLPGGNNHPGAASPNPVDGTASYPPYTTPPDHCLLDLFWMPTVQPYPISQPFATSGKINLNYQIAPFTYIERSTGMRAVLKSVKITALNPKQSCPALSSAATGASNGTVFATYKGGGLYGVSESNGEGQGDGGGAGVSYRRSIDLDKTVQEFEDLYFSNNKPFISESQICDVPLIPQANPLAGYVNTGIPNGTSTPAASTFDSYLATFWKANNLTGDNSLERPYVAIYPRITTKSNTFRVHVWVQTLKQLTGASASPNPAVFRNGIDRVTGEYRGSFVVERYLDPNTLGFYQNGVADTDSNPEQDANATLGPYKFRIVSSKQFSP